VLVNAVPDNEHGTAQMLEQVLEESCNVFSPNGFALEEARIEGDLVTLRGDRDR
jgi:hypothetical protein